MDNGADGHDRSVLGFYLVIERYLIPRIPQAVIPLTMSCFHLVIERLLILSMMTYDQPMGAYRVFLSRNQAVCFSSKR